MTMACWTNPKARSACSSTSKWSNSNGSCSSWKSNASLVIRLSPYPVGVDIYGGTPMLFHARFCNGAAPAGVPISRLP